MGKAKGKEKRPMRVLTVCAGAVCRSVAMALLLKSDGMDAVALSFDWNKAQTFKMLSRWADRIVVMEPKYAPAIPEEFRAKMRVCDVGPDVWRNPLHDGLWGKCHEWVKAGGLS